MLPFVDLHVHLHAGLDDGPTTLEEALEMCRLAAREGTRMAAAVAHQCELFPGVTPDRIRSNLDPLRTRLKTDGIDLEVYPAGEVMACPDLVLRWLNGDWVSLADQKRHLLVEMPHRLFVDLQSIAEEFSANGISIVLAHPERTEEFLFDHGRIEGLIERGCLVQVNASSVTDPPNGRFQNALREWFRRGVVHVLGSDGHSPTRRPPRLAAAVEQVRRWVGATAADRISNTLGRMILRGIPVRVAPPLPLVRRWWASFW